MRMTRKPSLSPRSNWCAPLAVALGLIASSGLFASALLAETPEEKGIAIAEEIDRRDLGFQNSSTHLKMILTNRHGESSSRQLRLLTLEVPEKELGDKSLTIFDQPRDIEGTAFLSFTKILESDDQWLYLPALKRVKRISSANKSGPFVGSEFAYEDLLSFEVAKYDYRWLRDEPCGDLTCFVVERFPLYENSGYTRQVTWVDQQEYRIMKIEFYDRKNALLKTLVQGEYNQYLGQYWRAHRLFMENHQTGKATELLFDQWAFRDKVNERDFNPNRLKRLR